MKSVLDTKIKYTIFAIMTFVCISLFFTLNTSALNENIDTSVKQTIVLREGETTSIQKIINNLMFGNETLKSATFNTFSLKIGTNTNYSLTNTGRNTDFVVSNSSWGLSDTKKSIEGTLNIVFTRSGHSQQEITDIPILVLYNTVPTINAPHIYVSHNDFLEYQKITNNNDANSLYQYIKNQITVEDVDNTYTNIEIFGANNNSFDVGNFKVGTTVQVCVSVTDINKTVSVPCYITILENETVDSTVTSKIRSISKEFYPYYRDDIRVDSNGYYYAKKVDGIYYFVDKSNNILKDNNEKPFAVDACLSSAIGSCIDNAKQIYTVIPKSKWITDGNCMSLLTNCLTNTDTSDNTKYISSWKFDNSDVKTIKKSISDGNLDKNFYYNYLSNGYCTAGTRQPNEMGRVDDATSLGANTGLVYYVSNDTLYILAKDVNNADYTYQIPNYDDMYSIVPDFKYNSQQKDMIISLMQSSGWTYLKTSAPWSNYHFTKVVLDDKITRIGNFAFYGLTNITEPINIPKNCIEIGDGAFMNCINMSGNLETKNVAFIGQYAFANCKELKGRLYLGNDSIQSIGNGAFMNCGFTQSLSVPSSVIKIGDYAFLNCKNFSGRLNLSSNLMELGEYAFAGCSGFDGDLVVPNSLTKLSQFTFANCYGFNGLIQLGNSLTVIDDYAFYNCYNLSGDVRLPENLTTIGVGAFKDCRTLKSTIEINANLKEIKSEAFANCFNITTINNNKQSKDLKLGKRVFYINTGIVTKITKEAFLGSNGGRGDDTSLFAYNYKGDHRVVSES